MLHLKEISLYFLHPMFGILDSVLGIFMNPALGITFRLGEIDYYPVNSAAVAYYIRVREATRKILHVDEAKRNIIYPHSDDEF